VLVPPLLLLLQVGWVATGLLCFPLLLLLLLLLLLQLHAR
jgi:hypothetical protein